MAPKLVPLPDAKTPNRGSAEVVGGGKSGAGETRDSRPIEALGPGLVVGALGPVAPVLGGLEPEERRSGRVARSGGRESEGGVGERPEGVADGVMVLLRRSYRGLD